MIQLLEQDSQHKSNSQTKGYQMSDNYKNKLLNFYKPMVDVFLLVLQQRSELLLGEWVQWNGYEVTV